MLPGSPDFRNWLVWREKKGKQGHPAEKVTLNPRKLRMQEKSEKKEKASSEPFKLGRRERP